jgi:hypothetical protein
MMVEKYGHVSSLWGSFAISIIPLLLFGFLMPETIGQRGYLAPGKAQHNVKEEEGPQMTSPYVEIS